MTEAPVAPQPPRIVIDLGPITTLVQAVHDRIENIWTSLTDLAQQFSDALRSMIEGLLPSALQALAGAVTAFSSLTSGLLENLTTSTDLWQSLLDTFGADLTRRIPHLVGDGYHERTRHNLDLEHSPGDPQQLLDSYERSAPPMQFLADVMSNILSVASYGNAAQAGGVQLQQQASLMHHEPTPLSPAELAQAVVQTIIGQDWAETHARRSGMSKELFDILVTAYGEPPGWQALLELWRRGTITEEQVDQGMRESRLKNKYVEPIKALRYVLPSPGDLIRFLVRS